MGLVYGPPYDDLDLRSHGPDGTEARRKANHYAEGKGKTGDDYYADGKGKAGMDYGADVWGKGGKDSAMRGNEAKDAFLAGYAAAAGERYYGLGAGAEWTRRMSHSLEELSRARSGYAERYDDWEEKPPLREDPRLATADMLRALTQLELWDVSPDRWMDITPDQFPPAPRPRGSPGKDPLEAPGAKGKRPEKGWPQEIDKEPAYWRERRLRLQGKSDMEEMESWRRFQTQPRSDGERQIRGKDGKGSKGEGAKGRLESQEAKIYGSSGMSAIHLQESERR